MTDQLCQPRRMNVNAVTSPNTTHEQLAINNELTVYCVVNKDNIVGSNNIAVEYSS
jgi:hypothetical protein